VIKNDNIRQLSKLLFNIAFVVLSFTFSGGVPARANDARIVTTELTVIGRATDTKSSSSVFQQINRHLQSLTFSYGEQIQFAQASLNFEREIKIKLLSFDPNLIRKETLEQYQHLDFIYHTSVTEIL
jgi:hypothetical protein